MCVCAWEDNHPSQKYCDYPDHYFRYSWYLILVDGWLLAIHYWLWCEVRSVSGLGGLVGALIFHTSGTASTALLFGKGLAFGSHFRFNSCQTNSAICHNVMVS